MSQAVELQILVLVLYFAADLVAGLGLNIQVGMTGTVNLAFIASVAAGAYVSGLLRLGPSAGTSQQYIFGATVPFPLDIIAGAVAGALLCVVLGVLLLPKLTSNYFAICSVVVGTGLVTLVADLPGFLNGSSGIYDIPAPIIHAVSPDASGELLLAVVSIILASLAFWFSLHLERAPVSRRLRAVRDNERSARSIGIDGLRYRIASLGLGGALGGLSGGILVLATASWGPDAWQIAEVIVLLTAVALGGRGNVWGVLAGVLVVEMGLGQGLLYVPAIASNPTVSANLIFVLTGLGEVAVFWWRPQGLFPERRRIAVRDNPRSGGLNGTETTGAVSVAHGLASGPIEDSILSNAPVVSNVLTTQDLSAHYGGVTALSGVTLSVEPGATCVVGPNGAGKSTLIDVLSGYRAASSGIVLLNGKPVSGPPHARAHAGIVRTFQLPQEFGSMTVFENVAVAMARGPEVSIARGLLGQPFWNRGEQAVEQRVWPILDLCGLGSIAAVPARILSGGQKKLLETARALAANPAVLLLDEPMAGVAPHLREEVLVVLERLRDRGLTMLVVAHEMNIVQRLATKVVVMNLGRIISEGDFSKVSAAPEVREAFLGSRR